MIKDSEYVLNWYVFKICARGYVYVIKFTKSMSHIKAREADSILDFGRSWGIKNKGRRFLVQSRGARALDKYFGKEGVQKAMWWQEIDSQRKAHNEKKQEILMRKNVGLTALRWFLFGWMICSALNVSFWFHHTMLYTVTLGNPFETVYEFLGWTRTPRMRKKSFMALYSFVVTVEEHFYWNNVSI